MGAALLRLREGKPVSAPVSDAAWPFPSEQAWDLAKARPHDGSCRVPKLSVWLVDCDCGTLRLAEQIQAALTAAEAKGREEGQQASLMLLSSASVPVDLNTMLTETFERGVQKGREEERERSRYAFEQGRRQGQIEGMQPGIEIAKDAIATQTPTYVLDGYQRGRADMAREIAEEYRVRAMNYRLCDPGMQIKAQLLDAEAARIESRR